MKKKSRNLAYIEGWLSIIINVLLFGLKYWAGIVTGSVAIIADAWHTLSDSLSSVVLVIGVKATTKPADGRHPFGHGRAELITAIIIGVILAIVGFNFLVEGISRLANHKSTTFGTLAVVVIAVSILLKEGAAQFAFRAAKITGSQAIRADGWHHRSDAVTSLIILGGILLGKYFWWIDGVLAVIVALCILYTTFDILKEAVNPLLGERPGDKLADEIKEICLRFGPAAIEPHHLHLHCYGEHRELTLHIYLHRNMTLADAHTIAEAIEDTIREELEIEATIHVEPLEEN